MTFRWTSAPRSGEAVLFTGSNADEISDFAPDRYSEKDGEVIVTDDDGNDVTLRPGWAVSRGDGEDGITVMSPAARARWMREVP